MRIIVNDKKIKEQLIKESKYIHDEEDCLEECPNLSLLHKVPQIIEVNDEEIDYERVLEIQKELEEYANWEGTELGEMTSALISLSHYPDYMTEDLWKVVYRELEYTLKMFQQQTRWVEKETTYTRKVKELEWK